MKHKIFGYGSLVSHKSLRKTIPDRKFTPAIVKGFRRVFNIESRDSEDPDVLNIQKSPEAEFNGVLFEVNEAELVKLKRREWKYNVEETECFDFRTGERIGKCLIFIDYIVAMNKKKRRPNREYFILCREAAYAISKEFGEFWNKSTYTAGGEVVSDWLKKNPEYDTTSS